MSVDYFEYIRSEKWQAIAKLVKQRAGGRCQGCNTQHDLEAHHTRHDHLGDELAHMGDLVCLCSHCHEAVHEVRRRRKEGLALVRGRKKHAILPGPKNFDERKKQQKAATQKVEAKERKKARKAKAKAIANHDWRKGLANPVPPKSIH